MTESHTSMPYLPHMDFYLPVLQLLPFYLKNEMWQINE